MDVKLSHVQNAFPCGWIYTGQCPMYPNISLKFQLDRLTLTHVRARGKSDSKTDRRIVQNHFSRRFAGCTISLKDTDRQRQSVVLTQVREEYRQRLLERPVEGAHEVESHCNSCLSSSHRLRLHALTKQNKLTYEISEIYGLLL